MGDGKKMVQMDQKKMTSGRSKLAGNTVSLTVSGAAGIIFTLIQLSVLSRVLTEQLFGLFVSLRGFSLLLSTVILIGLPQVMIRFYPSFQNRGEKHRAALLFLCSVAVVMVLGSAMLLTRGYWDALIPESTMDLISGEHVFWMSLASIALSLKLVLYGGFNGFRDMHLQMIFELIYLVVLTICIAVLSSSLDVKILFQLIFFINLMTFLSGLPVFIRSLDRSILQPAVHDGGAVLPSFLPYLGNSLLLSFVALAFTDFDRFIMSSALPLSAISLFHIASRINGLVKRFLGFPVIALQPEVTRIYEEGRLSELTERIALFTKTTLIAALLLSSLVAVVGREVIVLLSGSTYTDAYYILLILLPGVPLAAFIAPLLSTMKGLHYMKWAVLCDFLWMSVYFGTFFVFVSIWGVFGMAVAQILASSVQMTAAVLIARREGFYGGAGSRIGRVLLSSAVFVAAGTAATGFLGIPAAAAILILSPFLIRTALSRLHVFDSYEVSMIMEMIPAGAGRKAIAWIISREV